MKILADHYLYKLADFIPEGVTIEYFMPDEGLPPQATDFDALLFRTVTKIDARTLPQAGNLKFAGSATAGYDHVDTGHLEKLGVEFACSEGCNANAVAEYVITVLFRWAEVTGYPLSEKKVGIAGMGNTGAKVAGYLKKLNISYEGYDPPKSDRDPKFTSCSLDDLLQCDILTFHTPLIRTGKYRTWHMCGTDWLRHGFDLIVNASRGGVVDEKALLLAKQEGLAGDYILDVWEKEPLFNDETAKQAFIATPHIAGYSKEAKWLASKLVADQLCDHFGLKKPDRTFQLSPPESAVTPGEKSFAGFLWDHHLVSYYDAELRKIIGLKPSLKLKEFSQLRSGTDTRFEFASILEKSGMQHELKPSDPLRIFL